MNFPKTEIHKIKRKQLSFVYIKKNYLKKNEFLKKNKNKKKIISR